MSITRNISFDVDLTIEEAAKFFAESSADEQAQFLNAVGRIGQQWHSGGLCMQVHFVVNSKKLDANGRDVLQKFSDHLTGAQA